MPLKLSSVEVAFEGKGYAIPFKVIEEPSATDPPPVRFVPAVTVTEELASAVFGRLSEELAAVTREPALLV